MKQTGNKVKPVEPFPAGVFYVYELLSDDGVVFYVGKGAHDRYQNHSREARTPCQCQKCNHIRCLWEAGRTVWAQCVYVATDENDAWRWERERIAELKATHVLYNTSPGWPTPDVPGRLTPKSRSVRR